MTPSATFPSTLPPAPNEQLSAGARRSGMRVAALTLALVFLGELGVMFLLRLLFPGTPLSLSEDLVDAMVLVVLLTPFVLGLEARRRQAEQDRERVIAELKQALSVVKTLSGLLPICAHCKKIRDDKGYWTQIESYVRSHSEAEFSHGICPECAQRLYPEFVEKSRPMPSEM